VAPMPAAVKKHAAEEQKKLRSSDSREAASRGTGSAPVPFGSPPRPGGPALPHGQTPRHGAGP
jgi:hypothetical protein